MQVCNWGRFRRRRPWPYQQCQVCNWGRFRRRRPWPYQQCKLIYIRPGLIWLKVNVSRILKCALGTLARCAIDWSLAPSAGLITQLPGAPSDNYPANSRVALSFRSLRYLVLYLYWISIGSPSRLYQELATLAPYPVVSSESRQARFPEVRVAHTYCLVGQDCLHKAQYSYDYYHHAITYWIGILLTSLLWISWILLEHHQINAPACCCCCCGCGCWCFCCCCCC